MKYEALTIAAIVIAASFCATAGAADQTTDSLPTVRTKIINKEAVLVDVREKSEWDKGHVKGAIFLPLSELQKKADQAALAKVLPQGKIIYTHCVVGKRSLTAANILEKLGCDARSLTPGYKELIEAGFPDEKD